MDHVSLCPVCNAVLSRSATRYFDGSKCCVTCRDLAKASKASLATWFDESKIAQRRKVNPRFPAAEPSLVRRLIKECGLEGTLEGQEGLNAMAALREKLEHELNQGVIRQERYSLIFSVFRTLDQTYSHDLERIQGLANLDNRWSMPDAARAHSAANLVLGSVVKGLERVLEIAVSQDSGAEGYVTGEHSPVWLSEIATELAMTNGAIESYLYLWDKRGKVNVGPERWQLELTKEDQKRWDNMELHRSEDDLRHLKMRFDITLDGPAAEDWVRSLEEIRGGSAAKATDKLGFDIVEFLQTVDEAHRREFGHAFSEKLLVLLCLPPLRTKLVRNWAFEEEILGYLNQETRIPVVTLQAVLRSLSLAREDLLQEDAHPFELGRKSGLMRRPLPRLDVGAKHAYLLSIAIIGRCFFNVWSDYVDGTDPSLEHTETVKLIDHLKQRYSDYFVTERIYSKLMEQGYIARYHIEQVGSHDLRGECGEIDILIVGKGQNKLIVGEAKHLVNKCISTAQMRQEKTAYLDPRSGYVAKLRTKLQWVEDHKQEIFDFMGVRNLSDSFPCIPVFFTNIYTPASEFIDDIPFITVYENELWWHKLD